MEVIWFQSTRVVYHYRDGEDLFGDQAPNYHTRTELVRDAITNGNATLNIWDVRLLDAGRYKCLFEDGFHQEFLGTLLSTVWLLANSCKDSSPQRL
uniref:Ig-like domain-containing protein n=1 Tax=Vombatus ursinus TaxID=29139 RepID=A0A4X2MFK8_VOMUR